MAPVSWLPISAAAKTLRLEPEQVQDLIDAKVLHAESIGGDHLSVSAESVAALAAAERPAPTYRGGPRLDPQTDFEYDVEKNT